MIIRETGWTYKYVLWRVSYLNLMLLMTDRPSYKSKKKGEEEGQEVSGKEFAALLRVKGKAR